MGEPAVVVYIPFEGRPRLYVDALHESDAERVRDWVDSHPDLAALRDCAVETILDWISREAAEAA